MITLLYEHMMTLYDYNLIINEDGLNKKIKEALWKMEKIQKYIKKEKKKKQPYIILY